MLICPQCQAQNPDNGRRCISCQASLSRAVPGTPGTASVAATTRTVKAPSGEDSLGMGLIYGVLATLVAVALWIAVSRGTGMELRFMIVLIGAAAGLAVAYGARSTCSSSSGFVAAGFTVAALLLGNWIKSSMEFDDLRAELIADATKPEALVERLMGEIAEKAEQNAEPEFEDEGELHDEAKRQWDAMPPVARENLATTARHEIDETAAEWGNAVGFFAVFRSIWGIGWTIMGVGLAFRLGSRQIGT